MKLRGKILIVDDEPINLEFFDVMLTKLGFQVEKAVDGEEALERVQSGNPDLIILDNIMPKLSGWEVTRMLKQDPEYRRFLLVGKLLRAMQAGRPVSLVERLAALDRQFLG